MFRKAFITAGMMLAFAGSALAWGIPGVGGGESVDVKGLTGKADNLIEIVATANEKLGLGLVDVLTMTGKTEDASKVIEAVNALKSNHKTGNKDFFTKVESPLSTFKNMRLGKELEKIGKGAAASTSIGSAVMNIQAAVDSDNAAVKEAKGLSGELAKGVKSASTNPALVSSVGDLKSSYDAVSLIVDSVPKQIDIASSILKELREYASANGIALK